MKSRSNIMLWNIGIILFNIICFSDKFIGLDINSEDETIRGIIQTIIFFSVVILIYINKKIVYNIIHSTTNNVRGTNHIQEPKNNQNGRKTIDIKDRSNNKKYMEKSRQSNIKNRKVNITQEVDTNNKGIDTYTEIDTQYKKDNVYIKGDTKGKENNISKEGIIKDKEVDGFQESITVNQEESIYNKKIDSYRKNNTGNKRTNSCKEDTNLYKTYSETNVSSIINKLILEKDKKNYIKRLKGNKNKTTFSQNINYTLAQIDRMCKKVEVMDEIISMRFHKGDISYNKLHNSIKDIENIFYFNIIQIIHKLEAFDEKQYLYERSDRIKHYDTLKEQKNKICESYKQAVEQSISDNEEILIKLDELVLEFSGLLVRENTSKYKEIPVAIQKVDELIQISKYYK